MTLWQAIILGIIQGVTEFFPVSSSTHLTLIKNFFGIIPSEELVLFDLFCHVGTLTALVLFLKKQIRHLLIEKHRLSLFFIALLPLIPAYFLLKPLRILASQIEFLGLTLILTSFLLFISEKLQHKRPTTKRSSLIIGTMQACALIPGISRSASTLFGARLSGLPPKEAVYFSFLLSIPTILGGMSLELGKTLFNNPEMFQGMSSLCIAGGVTSFIGGYSIIRFAFHLLERGRYKPFAWYCLTLGVVISIGNIFSALARS
jgi:undecaprenyl-diphosphatase